MRCCRSRLLDFPIELEGQAYSKHSFRESMTRLITGIEMTLSEFDSLFSKLLFSRRRLSDILHKVRSKKGSPPGPD